jgi:hypothetical protein
MINHSCIKMTFFTYIFCLTSFINIFSLYILITMGLPILSYLLCGDLSTLSVLYKYKNNPYRVQKQCNVFSKPYKFKNNKINNDRLTKLSTI